MLITFKSKAAADVLMYEEHAKCILDLLHKEYKRGVITAAETAAAIESLENEIAESKRAAADALTRDAAAQNKNDDDEPAPAEPVSFSTRAYPLLEMLRAAHAANRDVVWGV